LAVATEPLIPTVKKKNILTAFTESLFSIYMVKYVDNTKVEEVLEPLALLACGNSPERAKKQIRLW